MILIISTFLIVVVMAMLISYISKPKLVQEWTIILKESILWPIEVCFSIRSFILFLTGKTKPLKGETYVLLIWITSFSLIFLLWLKFANMNVFLYEIYVSVAWTFLLLIYTYIYEKIQQLKTWWQNLHKLEVKKENHELQKVQDMGTVK